MNILNILKEAFIQKIEINKDLIQEPEIKGQTTEFANELPTKYLNFLTGIAPQKTNEDQKSYIKIYREMSEDPEIEDGIDEIANESLVVNESEEAILKLNLAKCDSFKDSIKEQITEIFEKILKLIEFKSNAHNIFKQWYVDGILMLEIVMNKQNIKNGIQKINIIDPLKIEKIETLVDPLRPNKGVNTVYKYSDDNIVSEVDPSLVIEVRSGYRPLKLNYETSYLHKSIKALNNLRNIEDSIIIYRLNNAPDRLVFNVDTGLLQKSRAEQYLASIIQKFGNVLVYDQTTGKIQNDKNIMALTKNFWFPKSAEGKGTEVNQLQGGKNLGELEDLFYFLNKLWKSLGVPISRRSSSGEQNVMFETGRTTQITRDEIIFYKKILKFRKKFSEIFLELLRRQLIATNVMSGEQFDKERENISFVFQTENYFSEIKESDLLKMRLETLQAAEPYIGKFFTKENIAFKILKYTEEEWEEIKKELEKPENANYQQSNAGFEGGYNPNETDHEEDPELVNQYQNKNNDKDNEDDDEDNKGKGLA